MSAETKEVTLGVSARYAEQIREFIEARARERLEAREEAARQAALSDERAQRLADAIQRASEQAAVLVDVRSAAPIKPEKPLDAAASAAQPMAAPIRLAPAKPAPAAPAPQASTEPARPGALLDTQV